MINEIKAKEYCCEDISLIENYDLAVNDITQTWICHHRLGIIENKSGEQLQSEGLYYNRPASELIFVTLAEHCRLHHTGKNNPNFGKPAWNSGKTGIYSEKTISKIRAANIGNQKRAKKIRQFTKSHEFIREWPSAMEAQRQLGISQSKICECCKHKRKFTGGFLWEYAL